MALLHSFNAKLLASDSATLTLEHWCATHRLAAAPHITAERVREVDKPATPRQRELLQVTADEPIRYRRVRLCCAGHVLSEADNWYVPSRLTPEMNLALDTTDVAFGRVVQSLRVRRRTLASQLLSPALAPPHVLQHTALLTLPDGLPISEVVETYTSALLTFPLTR